MKQTAQRWGPDFKIETLNTSGKITEVKIKDIEV